VAPPVGDAVAPTVTVTTPSPVTTNRATLDAIAAALLHDESLDREQFTAIAREHGALPKPQDSLPSPVG